jgi:alcohol dehydrogenase class IV
MELDIPGLKEIGIKQDDFDRIIQKSIEASSMKKNPVKLNEMTLAKILEESY